MTSQAAPRYASPWQTSWREWAHSMHLAPQVSRNGCSPGGSLAWGRTSWCPMCTTPHGRPTCSSWLWWCPSRWRRPTISSLFWTWIRPALFCSSMGSATRLWLPLPSAGGALGDSGLHGSMTHLCNGPRSQAPVSWLRTRFRARMSNQLRTS